MELGGGFSYKYARKVNLHVGNAQVPTMVTRCRFCIPFTHTHVGTDTCIHEIVAFVFLTGILYSLLCP